MWGVAATTLGLVLCAAVPRAVRAIQRWRRAVRLFSLKTSYDWMPDAVCASDARGKILYVNSAFERTLGYPADAIAGRGYVETLIPDANLANAHQGYIDGYLAGTRKPALLGTNGMLTDVCCKGGTKHPMWMAIGEVAPVLGAGAPWFVAMFSSRFDSARNAQLEGEKQKLEWEVGSKTDADGVPYGVGCPMKRAGLLWAGDHCRLGRMQDAAVTAAAADAAVSVDHCSGSGAVRRNPRPTSVVSAPAAAPTPRPPRPPTPAHLATPEGRRARRRVTWAVDTRAESAVSV